MITSHETELRIFQAMRGNHSLAYAEIMNLMELVRHHQASCNNDAECRVSIYLVRRTIEKMMYKLYLQEKQDVILKITEMKWM
jgi:hypothetical protein